MPLILPSNSITGGYEVDNSLRFDDGSSDSLTRTPSSAGNRKTFTLSLWFKRASNFGSFHNILWVGNDSNNRTLIQISDLDVIDLQNKSGGSVNAKLSSNVKRRDPSAWYHLVWLVDTTQATSSNRIKVYVNGLQETSFSTETYPSQNTDFFINNNQSHSIGKQNDASAGFFDGYMAEVCLIDGQALDPTSFGEFDEDTGIWKPKAVSGLTFGTNGFYLPFENSAALGQDDSGNGNNFTVNNLTSIDQSTDTPTNNYATLNPLNQGRDADTGTFSEGNLEFESTQTGGNYPRGISSIGVNTGKWYMEMKVLNSQSVGIGISNGDPNNELFADFTDDKGYSSANGFIYQVGSGSSYGDTFTTNDIIGIALDLDNNYLYLSKNGTFQNSGDPTSGATGTGGISVTNPSATGFYFFTVGDQSTPATPNVACNFGSPPYTISSGNSDADGYGNFEYSVPSGYYALNTKNLAEYG